MRGGGGGGGKGRDLSKQGLRGSYELRHRCMGIEGS